ncbi:IS5 family transposase, partial [Neisseria sp. N95_16]
MSSFFKQTVETIVGKDPDRFPLLKIQLIIDWQPIADYLEQQKGRYTRHHG